MPQTIEELMALVKELVAKEIEASKADKDPDEPAVIVDADPATPAEPTDAEKAAKDAEAALADAEKATDSEAAKSMDALKQIVKDLMAVTKAQDAKIKAIPVIDSASVIADIEKRDALYKRVVPLIGNFDANPLSKSVTGVATYALDKLSIKAEKGTEVAVLDAYLSGVEKTKTTDSVAVKAAVKVADNTWEV